MNPSPAPADDYQRLAATLTATGLVTDPWVDGRPRFAAGPLALPARQVQSLYRAAERMAAAVHEAALQVAAEPALLDDFFALTPVQKLLWQVSAPLWHGMARADLFLVGDRRPKILCCELNADTPSGQPEAVLLGPATGVPAERDPNRGLEARFGQLIDRFLGAVDRDGCPGPVTVGIVYPTEIAGDFALIRLYQRWCQARGLQVVLGSPYNLQPAPGGRVALFGTPCDLLIRHYKTDWWGERLPLWADEDPYPDPDPLAGPLAVLLPAIAAGRCAVLNPFGAVLTQNKRMLAYLWERRRGLSPRSQAAVRAHLPPTVRLEAADRGQLEAEQAGWVLKSDYGCEGEEVIIGRHLPAAEWRACLDQALPRRWIAQRFFDARRTPEGEVVNHGVYLVGGRAAGLYARLSSGATDAGARSAAVEVMP